MDTEQQNQDIKQVLGDRDIHFVLDNSGSMDRPEKNGTRWRALAETVEAMVRRFGPIGHSLNIWTFSNDFTKYANVTPEQIPQFFKSHPPGGGTALHKPFEQLFSDYLAAKKRGVAATNGLYIFLFTDGVPDDENAVAKVFSDFTQHLDSDRECNITIVQIANEPGAAIYLKRLDDDLEGKGAKYDIVDVITHDKFGSRDMVEVAIQGVLEHKQSA